MYSYPFLRATSDTRRVIVAITCISGHFTESVVRDVGQRESDNPCICKITLVLLQSPISAVNLPLPVHLWYCRNGNDQLTRDHSAAHHASGRACHMLSNPLVTCTF